MQKERIRNILKSIKKRLPANGDWLYVTEEPYDITQVSSDIADKYDTPDKVLKEIRSSGPEVTRLIYEQARAYEASICDSGNQVREKAKALLGTAGFISAILLGISAFLLSTAITSKTYIFIVEAFLFLLLTTHFSRSLSIGLQVMTREETVRAAPPEFLSFPETADTEAIENAMRVTISKTVAYANQTQEGTRRRANKLILGQHAFRYGLIFFVILLLFHIVAAGLRSSPERRNIWQSRMPSIRHGLYPKDHEFMNIRRLSSSCRAHKKIINRGKSTIRNECHLDRKKDTR